MLTVERAHAELLNLPLLTRVGLVILVVGGLADVAAHLQAAGHVDHLHEHTATAGELSAHLIGFVGMVVILLGVVLDGIQRSYRTRFLGDSIALTRATSTPRT